MKTLAVERLRSSNPYSILPLWTTAFEESFNRINTYQKNDNMFLDSAGGDGWLGSIVIEPEKYYLIDLEQSNIDKFDGPNKHCGSVEEMPYEDGMFDVIVSQSTLQYLNKEKYFGECKRVLKPGGYLCMHENGRYNPFILLVRLWRKVLTKTDANWKSYDDTIQGYLTDAMLPTDDFEVIYHKPYYFFTTISWIFDYLKFKRTAKVVEKVFLPIDNILMKLPIFNKMGFFNVYHLKKK